MQVTVFGASGKVGQLVVQRLLDQGHQVTVFVHSTSPFEPSEQLKIIKSDVHNAAFVENAVRGADAVISTLGSWHTPTKDILSAAMRFALPAMQQAGIRRIITLTGSGAFVPGEDTSFAERAMHRVFSTVAKDIIRDAETHIELLQASGLDWIVIRAPIMRGDQQTKYALDQNVPKAWETVSRAVVATAIVDQLHDTQHLQQAPHIHSS